MLLATYNGAAYLREQVDSLLAQDYPNLRILARDDGSPDSTRELLADYAARHPTRFTLLPADAPTGSAKWNFERLMQTSTAPYCALADQDDVWLPDKITSSFAEMQKLEQRHGTASPLLVFTDLTIVDEHLRPTAASFWRHQHVDPTGIFALRRLVTQNVLTGCTALMNRPLVTLAARMPEETPMHDWWIALVACAFGHAAFLRRQTILYRQHSANVVGAVVHAPPKLIPDFRQHTLRRREWEATERQVRAFLRIYREELSPANRALLEAFSRSETSPSRLTRVGTQVWHRFSRNQLRHTLAILWYLWDMKAAKQEPPR